MSTKIFCDFCDKEMTSANKIPSDMIYKNYKEIQVNNKLETVGSEDHKISLYISILSRIEKPIGRSFETFKIELNERSLSRNQPKNIDICKHCLKEIVNQM